MIDWSRKICSFNLTTKSLQVMLLFDSFVSFSSERKSIFCTYGEWWKTVYNQLPWRYNGGCGAFHTMGIWFSLFRKWKREMLIAVEKLAQVLLPDELNSKPKVFVHALTKLARKLFVGKSIKFQDDDLNTTRSLNRFRWLNLGVRFFYRLVWIHSRPFCLHLQAVLPLYFSRL